MYCIAIEQYIAHAKRKSRLRQATTKSKKSKVDDLDAQLMVRSMQYSISVGIFINLLEL